METRNLGNSPEGPKQRSLDVYSFQVQIALYSAELESDIPQGREALDGSEL